MLNSGAKDRASDGDDSESLTLSQLHRTIWQLMMPTFVWPDFPVLDWLGCLCVLADVFLAVGCAPLALPPTVAVRVSRVCLQHRCVCSLLSGEWWPL